MVHLTDQEKEKILIAVREAERHTNGELVTVICQRSDEYLYIPTLFAALLAFLVGGVTVMLLPGLSGGWNFIVQVLVFVTLALVFRWPPLTLWLVPKSVKYHRASLHAHALFSMKRLHLGDRNGIMLFVSVAERYVEVIADPELIELVDESQWRSIVDTFTSHVKKHQILEGYLSAIETAGELLSIHCSAKRNADSGQHDNSNRNFLPDHLIEL